MKNKTLKNGFSIPLLGLGTWGFGGREFHDPENNDVRQIEAIENAMTSGITWIDTAEYYADGYAETLVGTALKGAKRDSYQLCSKVWKNHLRRDDVWRAAENSLNRLKTDHFDLYLYHQIDESVPLEETLNAMNELVQQKIAEYIGVSNFNTKRLERAMQISEAPIVVNQVEYSLVCREPEKELLPFCQENDVILQAWRPLQYLKNCPLTDRLCEKYSISLQQLAIAWLVAQNSVTTISASQNWNHQWDNISAVNLQLDGDDIELLRREYPDQREISRVPLK
ncbi:MAG: aldo/keto reductase [Lentisphaeria bacterium]|nr:aldo/keto reductase [Lentisphaeria bacterium]